MKKRRYTRHVANADGWSDWIFPRRSGYWQACCDCGLVHVYQFKVRNRHILYRVRRDNRATAGIRRGMK